jgi:hypothetical protein
MSNERSTIPGGVSLGDAILAALGCNQLDLLWNSDLEFHYVGDEFGRVERASVSTGTRVIATAKRLDVRMTDNPEVTEIDVDETHFVRGTLNVVYEGRIVFQCRMEDWCQPIRVTVVSGTRSRNVFRRWPSRIDDIQPSAIVGQGAQ